MEDRTTKKEMINYVSKVTGISERCVGSIIDVFLDGVMSEMADGRRVKIQGFGTFEPKPMRAKIGRNLNTNEPVEIPARVIPAFKPGNTMKNIVTHNQ